MQLHHVAEKFLGLNQIGRSANRAHRLRLKAHEMSNQHRDRRANRGPDTLQRLQLVALEVLDVFPGPARVRADQRDQVVGVVGFNAVFFSIVSGPCCK